MEFEIIRTRIGRQRQDDGPPIRITVHERSHTVLAHVGRHGDGMGTQAVEHGLCVAFRRVAYVAALRVGDDQNILWHACNDALQGGPTSGAVLLKESQVGLEGRCI